MRTLGYAFCQPPQKILPQSFTPKKSPQNFKPEKSPQTANFKPQKGLWTPRHYSLGREPRSKEGAKFTGGGKRDSRKQIPKVVGVTGRNRKKICNYNTLQQKKQKEVELGVKCVGSGKFNLSSILTTSWSPNSLTSQLHVHYNYNLL